MCSCLWSRSWLCSDMQTSLLCKMRLRTHDREIFCGNQELRRDRKLRVDQFWRGWLNESGYGPRIVRLRDNIPLPDFKEDKSCNEDDDDGDGRRNDYG